MASALTTACAGPEWARAKYDDLRQSRGLPAILTNVFVDPYHPQAKADYGQMLQEVLERQPDGVLFDYVRYPRGVGSFFGGRRGGMIYGFTARPRGICSSAGRLIDRGWNSCGATSAGATCSIATLTMYVPSIPKNGNPSGRAAPPSPPLAAAEAPMPAAALRPSCKMSCGNSAWPMRYQGSSTF